MADELSRRALLGALGALTLRAHAEGRHPQDGSPAEASGNKVILSRFAPHGDGVADDLAAWQAAFKATPTGGVMHVSEGKYALSGPLTIDRTITLSLAEMSVTANAGFLTILAPNVTIVGAGGRKTVISQTATWEATGHDHWNIEAFGVIGLTVSGLGFDLFTDGPTASTTATGAINIRDSADHQSGSSDFSISQCWFRTRGSAPSTQNRFFGVFSGPPVGRTMNDGGRVCNNVFQQCKGRNVEIGYSKNIVAEGNLFLALGEDGAPNDAGGIAFRILGSENVAVLGNVIEAPASNSGFFGINVNGNSLNQQILVVGNAIRSSAALGSGCYGMRITNARNVCVLGNTVTYEGTAEETHGILIYTNVNSPCDEVFVQGNCVEGWHGSQIGIAENGGLIVSSITIRGNCTRGTQRRYEANNKDMTAHSVDISEGHRQVLQGWTAQGQALSGQGDLTLPDALARSGRLMPRNGSITALALGVGVGRLGGGITIKAEKSGDGGVTWKAIPGCLVELPGNAGSASAIFPPATCDFLAGDLLRLVAASPRQSNSQDVVLEAVMEVET